MISESQVSECVRVSGYEHDIPLAVGISDGKASPLFFMQGTLPDGSSVNAESVFYVGSLAKQLTGACVAILERDGALAVDYPISDWMPEFPAWSRRVYVRHLLHHTAGLPDVWEAMTVEERAADRTSARWLGALAGSRSLDHEPGTRFEYSNLGYICLAAIVERVSSLRFGEFARSRIFDPLAMKQTRFWSGPEPTPPDSALVPEPHTPAPLSVGDGGMWTSTSDLLRWNTAVLDDAFGVSERTHTPGTLDDGTPLDYAWGVRVFTLGGLTAHSHGGSWGTATAKLVRVPERNLGFAAFAADASVERMVALGDALQSTLFS